jgi:endonuclease/exonuclease/phosphatase family metal-dependent hydrolase
LNRLERSQRAADRGPRRLASAGVVVLATALTVGGVFVLNRFVHQRYVNPSAPRHGLRVMTWNLGKVYLPWESRASDRDLRHVAKVIREVNPHVVALQELRDQEQLGRLLAALGRGWRGAVPHDVYDRRAGLLIRLHGRFFELPTSSGRVAQGATLALAPDRELVVVSLHLDAFDPERRLEQGQEIVAEAARRGGLYVLAGDFNFDLRMAAKRSADHRLYGLLSADLVDAGARAGATTMFSRRLDYVYHQRRFDSEARVLRGRRINTMDHDLLIVDLRLTSR